MNKDIIAAEGFIKLGNFNPPIKSKSAKIILIIPTVIIVESLSPYTANSSDIFPAFPPLNTEG